MAYRTIRGFVLTAAAVGVLASAASAQEEGDAVQLTLKSGKKVNATFLYKDGATVKVRVGASEMNLPVAMVVSIDKVGGEEPSPAPAPEPADEPAPGSAPPSGGPAAGPAGGPPKGASLILKDGRVLEGFVVAKGKGLLWIVPGRAIAVDEADIEEAIGNTEP